MNYKKLSTEQSELARKEFASKLPKWAKNPQPLYTLKGTLIANSFERVVVGDYGAFIEISTQDVERSNIKVKTGQEYRDKNPRYSNKVKYSWLTAKDDSDCKIYYQKRTVNYADYKIGYLYIAPEEVAIKN